MGLTTYAFILFGISVAFFFLGAKPMMLSSLGCDTTEQTQCTSSQDIGYTVITDIINVLKENPIATGLIGATIISSLLLGGTFIVMYVVPILILVALSNFFLLPVDFIYSNAMPFEIRVIIFGFINLMLVLTIVGFIRGGE